MGRDKKDPVARALSKDPHPHSFKLPPDVVTAVRKEIRFRLIAGARASFNAVVVAMLRKGLGLPDLTYNQRTGKYEPVRERCPEGCVGPVCAHGQVTEPGQTPWQALVDMARTRNEQAARMVMGMVLGRACVPAAQWDRHAMAVVSRGNSHLIACGCGATVTINGVPDLIPGHPLLTAAVDELVKSHFQGALP